MISVVRVHREFTVNGRVRPWVSSCSSEFEAVPSRGELQTEFGGDKSAGHIRGIRGTLKLTHAVRAGGAGARACLMVL